MFIPANFAIGALVGAAASYVYKDESARAALSGLTNKVKDGFGSTLGKLKKKPEAEEAVDEVTQAVEEVTDEVKKAAVEEVEASAESKGDKA